MSAEERQHFYELIETKLSEKGLSLFELAKLTSIPEGPLRRVVTAAAGTLPAGPYVRGYILKIAPHLGMEGDELWRLYRETHDIKTSGPHDELPANRYAFRLKKKTPTIVALAIVGLLFLYAVVNGARLLGAPRLTVFEPAAESSVVHSPEILIRGAIGSSDSVTINNESVAVASDGTFEARYTIEPGLTTFAIRAKRFLGKETSVTRQVVYEVATTTTPLVP